MRLDRERGEGIVLYSGEKRGDWFVGVGLGFSGYEMTPRRSYRFMHPTIHLGRLFSDQRGRIYSRRILIPCSIWDRCSRLKP